MIIDCISDLHGEYPHMQGGDLLIIAGDLTANDTERQHSMFCHWLSMVNYRKKIIIGGNHDNGWVYQWPHKGADPINPYYEWYEYLSDSPTEFQGFKIWGSPWTLKFESQNPRAMAFCLDTEEQLAEKWTMIPDDIDILITHSPPSGILDTVNNRWKCGVRVGSPSLRERVTKINPKLHVFGHIHGSHGKFPSHVEGSYEAETRTIFVNASHVNEDYDPVNQPIRIILS